MLLSISTSAIQPVTQSGSPGRLDVPRAARRLWSGPRAMETIRDMRMRQIAETINREPDNWNRIRECIRTVGLSSAYLSVRFKDAAGLPMRSYALWMKFEHACEMVIAGERPSEAALKAGFADQSHLGRAARRFAKKSFWRAIHELSQELETNNASGSEVRTGAA